MSISLANRSRLMARLKLMLETFAWSCVTSSASRAAAVASVCLLLLVLLALPLLWLVAGFCACHGGLVDLVTAVAKVAKEKGVVAAVREGGGGGARLRASSSAARHAAISNGCLCRSP